MWVDRGCCDFTSSLSVKSPATIDRKTTQIEGLFVNQPDRLEVLGLFFFFGKMWLSVTSQQQPDPLGEMRST